MAFRASGITVSSNVINAGINNGFQLQHQALDLGAAGQDEKDAVLQRDTVPFQTPMDNRQAARFADVIGHDPASNFV